MVIYYKFCSQSRNQLRICPPTFAVLANKTLHIALVGNPNSGKSSLFNAFTGLNQHVGNFPGVTVDKKTGIFELEDNRKAELIDLPGTYSLYPRRADEWVAYKVLMGADKEIKADLIVLVADASNLKRNLLFLRFHLIHNLLQVLIQEYIIFQKRMKRFLFLILLK